MSKSRVESGPMRVAIGQISPVFLDRARTVEKVKQTISEAANAGASLVAFGETLVPAYPLWLSRTGGARFDDVDQKTLHALYLREAVDIRRGHLDAVCTLCASAASRRCWASPNSAATAAGTRSTARRCSSARTARSGRCTAS
ncbi:MAG: nitrilase-related carbon-nitrogen hydrolase [Phycisphaerales bacterium]